MINVKKIVTIGSLFVLLAQSFVVQAMGHQLLMACYNGDISTVELLLATNRIDVNYRNYNGITPLHYACRYDRTEIVKLLLAKNADVNAKNIVGEIPLHKACEKDKIDIVRLLLEAGAEINAENTIRRRSTPLSYACLSDHNEIVKLLLANGAQLTINTSNDTRNLAIRRLLRDIYNFQQAPNKLEFILKHIQNDQEDDDIFHHMRISENAKELVKIVCRASLVQMLKDEVQIEEALFYNLYQHAPDVLSQTFEVESLQVDNLMNCIIKKTGIEEKDTCLAEQMQKRYLWLTKQMQERLAEYKNLLINTSERFEFLKQQCTDRGMTISTNDRELKMPSFLGLQVVSPLLVEEIEEEEEGE